MADKHVGGRTVKRTPEARPRRPVSRRRHPPAPKRKPSPPKGAPSGVPAEIESQLREMAESYRLLFQHSIDANLLGEVVRDESGEPREYRLLDLNAKAEELLGRSRKALIGRTSAEIFPKGGWHSEIRALADSVVRTGRAAGGDFHSPLLKRHLRAQAFPLSRDRVILILQDISEQRQAEEERERLIAGLREANARLAEDDRRKDDFLAVLAHELRNPLAPIRNAVQVLRLTGPHDRILERQRDIIDRQAAHMAHLLDDLLDVSRITRGRINLQRRPVDLSEVLSRAVESATPLIESRRHKLTVSPPAGRLRVFGDFDRLIQIVGNLLNNAAKYTPEGGRIWLEAERENGGAVVRVRDTGVGIPADALGSIFDVFAQGYRSPVRPQEGLGLGLTLVRNLVELHGGSVEARSEGKGKGSEFVVRLPAMTEAEAPRRIEAESGFEAETEPRRVLIVDDVRDTADSLAELLSLFGHDVRAVYDGEAAFRMLHEFRPEIVILDIGLPGVNGYEVARRIRSDPTLDGVKIVAMTGYGQDEDRRRAREAGFDRHLTKPVELRVLKQVMKELYRR